MADKLWPYINTLMTTVLDKEQEDFVKELAWSELKRLNIDIEEFLRKYSKDDTEEVENTKKLLQEEQSNDKSK